MRILKNSRLIYNFSQDHENSEKIEYVKTFSEVV